MEFKELVGSRRTVRRFLPDPIAKSDIKEIIQTATKACNSGNEQNWRFIVIQSETLKKKMAQTVRDKAAWLNDEVEKVNQTVTSKYVPQEFILEPPIVIAVVATSTYWSKPDLLMFELGYSQKEVADLRCRGDMQTIGAVTQLILLAAWENGFGGCWMTGLLFARKELEELLGIADDESLAALIPIGKPAIMPASRGRKPVEEVISFFE